MRNVPIVAALLFYLLAVADLTLLEYPLVEPEPNFTPFRTIQSDLSGEGSGIWSNLAANLVLLTPLGVLLPMLEPRRIGWKLTAAAALVVSLAIEVGQYTVGHRVADVDDVLLNVVSGLIGYGLFQSARELLGGRTVAAVAGRSAGPRRGGRTLVHRGQRPDRPHLARGPHGPAGDSTPTPELTVDRP